MRRARKVWIDGARACGGCDKLKKQSCGTDGSGRGRLGSRRKDLSGGKGGGAARVEVAAELAWGQVTAGLWGAGTMRSHPRRR
jgi:hypothetical protein